VERFLKWEKDEAQRKLALQAALPRLLNQDVLAVLQGPEEVERLFGWLKSRSFVVQHPDGWQYHAIVRAQMLRYQRRLSLSTWERLHGQLAAYYDERRQKLGLEEKAQWPDEMWQGYTLEWLYHRLCEAPQKHMGLALNGWLAALKQSQALAREWAQTMTEAGDVATCAEVKRWGERLREALAAAKDKRYDEGITALSDLLKDTRIEPKYRAVALNRRGHWHYKSGQVEFAISDYRTTIELDAEDSVYWGTLGWSYQYRKYFDDAIIAYQKAIELDPKYAPPHNGLGNLYRDQKHYDEAISAYQQAIAIDPQFKSAFANLGETYRFLERYPEAIQFCDRALEIDAKYEWAIYQRGYAYLLLKHYDRAIPDFDQAIALAQENDWYYYCRAIAHLARNHLAAADSDMARAIDLAQTKYDQDPTDWQNTFNLALYHLIANHFDIAEGLYRQASLTASRDFIQSARRDLQDLLSLFPDHELAQQMVALLQV
jgi:tetratricopeptide (TPR) repeat protein